MLQASDINLSRDRTTIRSLILCLGKFRFIEQIRTRQGFSLRRSCRVATDEVCSKMLCFYANLGEIATFSTSSAPSGHLLLKEKALVCANLQHTDKLEFTERCVKEKALCHTKKY